MSPAAMVPPVVTIVRVMPNGDALFSGTAAPNAKVEILERTAVLGATNAAAGGAFSVTLAKALTPGEHELSIRSTSASGATQLLSDARLAVTVPATPDGAPRVVLNSPGAAPQVLQAAPTATAAAPPVATPPATAPTAPTSPPVAVAGTAPRPPAPSTAGTPAATSAPGVASTQPPAATPSAPATAATTATPPSAATSAKPAATAAATPPPTSGDKPAATAATAPSSTGDKPAATADAAPRAPATAVIRSVGAPGAAKAAKAPAQTAAAKSGTAVSKGIATSAGATVIPSAPRFSSPRSSTGPVKTATVTVQRGDTLASIAALTLGNADRWTDIYNANRSRIPNPRVIQVGQVLVIPR